MDAGIFQPPRRQSPRLQSAGEDDDGIELDQGCRSQSNHRSPPACGGDKTAAPERSGGVPRASTCPLLATSQNQAADARHRSTPVREGKPAGRQQLDDDPDRERFQPHPWPPSSIAPTRLMRLSKARKGSVLRGDRRCGVASPIDVGINIRVAKECQMGIGRDVAIWIDTGRLHPSVPIRSGKHP